MDSGRFAILRRRKVTGVSAEIRQCKTIVELRSWELALRILARIQDQSRFYHPWYEWDK